MTDADEAAELQWLAVKIALDAGDDNLTVELAKGLVEGGIGRDLPLRKACLSRMLPVLVRLGRIPGAILSR